MTQKPIFFLHIWKTGGSTLATRLGSAFPVDRAYTFQQSLFYPQHLNEFKRLVSTFEFIQAHIHGPFLDGIEEIDIITAIRNPIDRIISGYREMIRHPSSEFRRPARKLNAFEFFSAFGYTFENAQTHSLVSSFLDIEDVDDYGRLLSDRLHQILDRIRWIVPTEAIDEFVPLWSLETGIRVPYYNENANKAPPDQVNISELRSMLLKMPHLYALDLYLWHVAQDRFTSYRKNILGSRLSSDSEPGNATRAFFNNGSGIWLTKGWYAPVVNSHNIAEWAAGPKTISKIKLIKRHNETLFQFVVVVVLGIGVSDIRLYREGDMSLLLPTREKIDHGRIRFTVNIEDFQQEEVIRLIVPRVSSLIQEVDEEYDTRRWAYKLAELVLLSQ